MNALLRRADMSSSGHKRGPKRRAASRRRSATPARKKRRAVTLVRKKMPPNSHLRDALARKRNVPYFSMKHKCFKLGKTKLKGVRPFLARHFIGKYTRPTTAERNGAGGSGGGLRRGSRVSQDLVKYCNATLDERRFLQLHGYTRALLAQLERWGWRPYRAEFTVCFPRRKMGTAVDLLVKEDYVCPQSRRRRVRLVALEIKCGMLGTWNVPSASKQKMLAHPLHAHANTQRNHALMQLALTHAMLRDNFNNRRLQFPVSCDAYVVRITERGVQRVAMPQWCERDVVVESCRILG